MQLMPRYGFNYQILIPSAFTETAMLTEVVDLYSSAIIAKLLRKIGKKSENPLIALLKFSLY